MAQEWPRGATPRPRSGVAAERSNHTSKEQQLHRCRKAERSYSMFKVRRGDLVQGKESSPDFIEALARLERVSFIAESGIVIK